MVWTLLAPKLFGFQHAAGATSDSSRAPKMILGNPCTDCALAQDVEWGTHLPIRQVACSRFCSWYDPQGSTNFNTFQQGSRNSLNRK